MPVVGLQLQGALTLSCVCCPAEHHADRSVGRRPCWQSGARCGGSPDAACGGVGDHSPGLWVRGGPQAALNPATAVRSCSLLGQRLVCPLRDAACSKPVPCLERDEPAGLNGVLMSRNLHVPGYGSDTVHPYKRSAVPELHRARAAVVRRTIAEASSKASVGRARAATAPGAAP